MKSKNTYLILGLLILLFFNSCKNEISENKSPSPKKKIIYTEKENAFKTKLKSLTEFYHKAEYGKIKPIGEKKKYKQYDTLGNKILEIFYSSANIGEIFSKNKYVYDNKSNLIEMIEFTSSNKVLIHDYYSYNELGLLTEIDHQNPMGTASNKILFKYNSKNLMSEKVQYDNEGNFEYKEVFKYDSLNNLISLNKYGVGSRIIKSESYEYDIASNLIKKEEENFSYSLDKDNIGFIYIYKYDNEGNLLEENQYLTKYYYSERKIPSFSVIYKYNKKGEKIESETTKKGITYTTNFVYDEKGNIVEKIFYNNVNEIVYSEKYSLEYFQQ